MSRLRQITNDLTVPIDRSSPVPLYHQVKEDISSQIATGALRPGQQLPVEHERQRLVDGQPWVLVFNYLPLELFPGLVDRDLGGGESLYRIIRQDYELPIIAGTRRVEAAVADEREAPFLGIRPGDPVVVLRSLSFTVGMRPIEYFVAHHRGDRTAFEVVLAATDGRHVTRASELIHVTPS